MTNSVLSLKSRTEPKASGQAQRRKIERSQWPDILARRNDGASQSQIAEAYGVSQGTISQVLKKAAAETEAEPLSDSGNAIAANDQVAPEPTAGAEIQHGSGQPDPLAARLRNAADGCAGLVESGTASGEAIAEAAHEVRRALAAVEIEAARRASAVPVAKAADRDHRSGQVAQADAQLGKIKFFNPEKGFGFILPDDGGKDVFLSRDTVKAAGLDDLAEGDPVEFEAGPGKKGPEAKTVRSAS